MSQNFWYDVYPLFMNPTNLRKRLIFNPLRADLTLSSLKYQYFKKFTWKIATGFTVFSYPLTDIDSIYTFA